MNLDLLIENVTNPALLFFLLGIIAVYLKSDLEIPNNTSKFISLYLLFSIGFKGGQELAHSEINIDIFWSIVFGMAVSVLIPLYTFFILKKKFSIDNSGAIAAAYGSVSAVTFVTAISFLEMQGHSFSGHMVAVMALMEAPAIIVGVILIRMYSKKSATEQPSKLSEVIKHSFTNGHVVISGIPVTISESEVALVIEQLLADLHDGIPENSFSQSDTIAKSMAKSLAVKTGTYLTEKEQENVVNGLFACKEPNISPFNKPTFITMRVEDLDKKFAV